MSRPNQHPLVRLLADRARRKSAAVYSDQTFTAATWPDGKRAEIRVDTNAVGTKASSEAEANHP
jgi:hypothetical protein